MSAIVCNTKWYFHFVLFQTKRYTTVTTVYHSDHESVHF